MSKDLYAKRYSESIVFYDTVKQLKKEKVSATLMQLMVMSFDERYEYLFEFAYEVGDNLAKYWTRVSTEDLLETDMLDVSQEIAMEVYNELESFYLTESGKLVDNWRKNIEVTLIKKD